ncbi:MAG: hypothetical protein C4308_07165 [Chitinophagaceae bacterium]
MKIIPILFFTVAVNLTTVAQTDNDAAAMLLKGNVKLVKTQETHRYKKDGVFTPWAKSYSNQFNFNKKGIKTEYLDYSPEGLLTYKIVYTYYPSTRTVEEIYLNKDVRITSKNVIQLNEAGKKTETVEYSNTGSPDKKPLYTQKQKYVYNYDKKGNLIEAIAYNENGLLLNKTSWKYNSKGNQVEWKLETPGYATSVRSFAYDDNKNKIEEKWYKPNGEVQFLFKYKYDDNGNKIEESKYINGVLKDINVWKEVRV